jgi:predicted peptidase
VLDEDATRTFNPGIAFMKASLLPGGFLVFAVLTFASGAEFTEHMYTAPDGKRMPYRLLLPEDYRKQTRYPLVLFFHGAGERGTNNTAQLVHGTKLFLKPDVRSQFPCIVVAPQCPGEQQWVDMPWAADSGRQPEKPSATMALALAILDSVEKEWSIDPDRLYLTGISMGGFATWDLITRYPERFAAAAPICGGGDPAKAGAATRVPVWAFHSDDDTTVKVKRSREMVEGMRKAGGKPRYVEYSGLGHNCWDKAYSEPELLPWMFAQRRGQSDTYVLQTKSPR